VTRIVSVDGEIVPPERAVVSVLDRGFLYGDGVFETLRVYGARPFARDEHMARLARSCAAIRIALPVPEETLARELDRAVTASTLTDAYARVTITRGVGERTSLVPSGEQRPTRVILVEPLTPSPRATYASGLRAITLPWTRAPEGSPASRAKLLSYVTSLAALDEARARGADDAIFVGADAVVRDASTSNVFLVDDDGVVLTPPEGAGVLAGITRAHVIELARTLGVTVSLVPLVVADLVCSREAFLTSSLREIAPVVSIDGIPIGGGAPGPITRAVHRAYRKLCGLDGAAPWE
jgi:branched-chain amino acid aminotransferase